MAPTLIQCYNKGCGQKFHPEENTNESCTYHPGPPYFHDAYKIWKCCDKKSTDFSTWLSYKGCTKGCHNGEKPADVVKQTAQVDIRSEKPEEVIVWNGLNKPAERVSKTEKREMRPLKVEIHELALKVIQEKLAQKSEADATDSIAVGTPCQNNACKKTYTDSGENNGDCFHHPGAAIFHEGLKYWTCCKKKTSDFSAFLDQIGCTTGTHCWIKSERVDKVREDWFSRSGYIHFNIYCRGAIPEKCSFQTDGLRLRIRLVHGFGEKETAMDYDLWGEVIPSESHVQLFERKVELVLKQATADGWPKLLYDSEKKVAEQEDVEQILK